MAADVFTTDPQLAATKYMVLTDTKHQFGFQNVAPIVSKKKASELGATFKTTVDAVSGLLTLPAIRAMLKANYTNRTDPKVIADRFLKANSLT